MLKTHVVLPHLNSPQSKGFQRSLRSQRQANIWHIRRTRCTHHAMLSPESALLSTKCRANHISAALQRGLSASLSRQTRPHSFTVPLKTATCLRATDHINDSHSPHHAAAKPVYACVCRNPKPLRRHQEPEHTTGFCRCTGTV